MNVDAYLNGLMASLIKEIQEWSDRPAEWEDPLPEVPWASVVFFQARSRLEGTLEALARTGAMDAAEVMPRMERFDAMLEDRGLLRRETVTGEMSTEQHVAARMTVEGGEPPAAPPEEQPSAPPQPAVLVAVVPILRRPAAPPHSATGVTAVSLEVWSDRMRFHYVLQPSDAPTGTSSREHFDAMSALTRQHRDWRWDAWDDTGATYRTLSGGGELLGGPKANPPLWAQSVVLSPGPGADAREMTIRGRKQSDDPITVTVELPPREDASL